MKKVNLATKKSIKKKTLIKVTKSKPLDKMAVGDFSFYVYMPRSYYRSRFDSDSRIITIKNFRDIDTEGKGLAETLNECIYKIANNKIYYKCLDELVILKVTVTNKLVTGCLSPLFSGGYLDGYELVLLEEIPYSEFKKFLAFA